MAINILIIDDDYNIRTLLNDVFTLNGFNVTVKSNCKYFLQNKELLKDFKAIIIDYNLPHITGAEFVNQVRNLIPETLIIGISAYYENQKHFLSVQANHFFPKPFNIFELVNYVKEKLSE